MAQLELSLRVRGEPVVHAKRMRFSEMHIGIRYGADARHKETRRVVRALLARGWEPLDFGMQPCFVQALLVSPCGKRVVKIASKAPKPDTGNTDRYPEFARWVWLNQGALQSPHLPKFYAYREIGDIVVVCMERLTPAGSSNISESKRARRISDQVDTIDGICDRYDWTDAKRQFGQKFRRTFAAMSSALGFPTDLHSGNVMVRTGPRGGNPVLVLIDPYGYR